MKPVCTEVASLLRRQMVNDIGSFNLPYDIVRIYGMKDFRTHDFQSRLTMTIRQLVFVDTNISKRLFADQMPQNSKTYGVLLFPKLSFPNEGVSIKYAIAIPLTDGSIPASVLVDYNGKLRKTVGD